MTYFYLMDSEKLISYQKTFIQNILEEKAKPIHIKDSLLKLTEMLFTHYGKPVILLIDEYDVPLAKASANGYYKEMLSTIKGILSVLKDNSALHFAIVTGCLQIAKESIFTGTNNFVSDTISNSRFDEYFGFTQLDVDKILLDTKLTDHTMEMKDWYNGYNFGKHSIYCPRDVMNHVKNLLLDPEILPASYWEHTSHNDIIYQFLNTTEADVNDKFETLLSGEYIMESIEPNLTYDILHSSERNLWTLLYFTGYLTKMLPEDISEPFPIGKVALKIPNKEIQGSTVVLQKRKNTENYSVFIYNYLKHNGGENMSRVYTIKTRLDMDGFLGDYLKNYITFYSRLSRVIFRDIITGVVKEFCSVSKYVTSICLKFGVTKRTVNSIRYDMNGRIRAYRELKKTELRQLEIKIEGLESKVSKRKEELRKLFPLVAENRASKQQLDRYRQCKTSLYYATMKLERTRHKRERLKKAMEDGKVSICFGSKRFFHSQFHLKEHGYKTHEKWLHDFRKARDGNLYYLGCGSESYGNQMLQLQPSKDGSYTLHIRKENLYGFSTKPQDKWITISGI